jgi:hypothetical protein
MEQRRAKGETEAKWRERVNEWRASGKTAVEFVQGRSYAGSTLQYWSSRLDKPSAPPGFVQLVGRSERVERGVSEFVVEVGGARVRVRPGFDAALLCQVVRALGGGAP